MSAQNEIGKQTHELAVWLQRMHDRFVSRGIGGLGRYCFNEHGKPVQHAVVTQRRSALGARRAADDHGA